MALNQISFFKVLSLLLSSLLASSRLSVLKHFTPRFLSYIDPYNVSIWQRMRTFLYTNNVQKFACKNVMVSSGAA